MAYPPRSQSLLLLLTLLLRALSLATGMPLPAPLSAPLLLLLRRQDTDDDGDDDSANVEADADADDRQDDEAAEVDSHEQAIILSCSIVGVLVLAALSMALFLWYRRRHPTPATLTSITDPSTTAPSSAASDSATATEKALRGGAGSSAQDCSWCYIAESGVCKWCSGEADDDAEEAEDSKRSWSPAARGRLVVETADLKQSGWRSVLNSPSVSRNPSPRGGGRSPVDSVMGRERERERSPGGGRSPGGSITGNGKRSFRPGGIYEVPSATVALPERPASVLVKERDDITELERGRR